MGDLDGRIILVTGGTEGLGKVAAREFARRGATLTIVGRNPEKTERVAAELTATAGGKEVAFLLGDLSVLADVRAVAARFKEQHARLDVLLNNAGALFAKHQLTPDGYELTFALNHLGYFLLTRELMPLLQHPGARVVSTSSAAHRGGNGLDLATVATRPGGSAGWAAYGESKLANILFTRELARRLAPSGATANCVHPGWVYTGFARNNRGMGTVIGVAAKLVARTPEKGAETLVWAAASPEAAALNGAYLHDRKVASTSRRAKDDVLASRLWAVSDELCDKPHARTAA